jgi:hypothetical protein
MVTKKLIKQCRLARTQLTEQLRISDCPRDLRTKIITLQLMMYILLRTIEDSDI